MEENSFIEDSQEDNVIFFYTYLKNPKKIESLLQEILIEENFHLDIEALSNKKWKYYQRASRMIMLNEPNKLILGEDTEIQTGSWEYIDHSNLMLFNIVETDRTKHLVYFILFISEELLVLTPHNIIDEESENSYFELFYSTKKKPTQSQIIEILGKTKKEDESLYIGLTFFFISLLLLIIYFTFLY